MTAHIDTTQLLIVGVPAYIAAFGAAVASVISALNRRAMQTPSGDPIGHVAERTHDLAAVNAASLGTVARDSIAKSVERLNDDEKGPITVERRTHDEPPPNGEERRHG